MSRYVFETSEVDKVIRELGIAEKIYEEFLSSGSPAVSPPCKDVTIDTCQFYIECFGGKDLRKDSIWIDMYYRTQEHNNSKPYIWFYPHSVRNDFDKHGRLLLTEKQIQVLTELIKNQPHTDRRQKLFKFG